MANNYTKILELANKNNMGLSNTIKRDYGIPLDYSSVQESYEAAVIYAATSTLAYVGQPIAVGGTLYIIDSVADEAKFTAADEKEYDNYLKEVGTKPTGDETSISVDEDGKVSIKGFAAANNECVPSVIITTDENGDETRELQWVPISYLVEDDKNDITKIELAEDSALTISSKKVNDTTTYTLDVTLPAIPEYSVAKSVDGLTTTYTLTKDEVAVGEPIVVQTYDDSAVTEDISKLTERVGNIESELDEGDYEARLGKIEAFFDAADHDGEAGGLNDALDTLVEIQSFLNGEGGAVDNMLDAIAANTAAIGVASAPAEGEEGSEGYKPAVQASGLHADIEDIEYNIGLIEEDIEGLDSRIDDLESISKSYLDNKVGGKVVEDAIKSDIEAAQQAAEEAKELIGAASAEGKAATGAYIAIEAAAKAAQEAQSDVDDLEVVVYGEDGNGGVKATAETAKESADGANERLDIVDRILAGYADASGNVTETVKADVEAAQQTANNAVAAIGTATNGDKAATGAYVAIEAAQKTADDAVAAIGTASAPASGTEGEDDYVAAVSATGAYVAIEAAQQTADEAKELAGGNDERLDAIENDYVRVAKKNTTDTNPSLFVGRDGAAMVIFNCGTATTNTD